MVEGGWKEVGGFRIRGIKEEVSGGREIEERKNVKKGERWKRKSLGFVGFAVEGFEKVKHEMEEL